MLEKLNINTNNKTNNKTYKTRNKTRNKNEKIIKFIYKNNLYIKCGKQS